MQAITLLDNWTNFTKFMALLNFKWESMEKPKMWNILKIVHRRAKGTEIWDSRYYCAQIEVTFDARLLEFGLGSFGALCKISNFTICETRFLPHFSSDFI